MNEDAFEVPERNEYRYLVQEEEEDEVQYVRHRHYINPLLVLSRRCIFLICVGVLALLCLAAYLGYIAQTLPPGLAVVTTHCGDFRGRHKDGAYSFKGMPYAAPPVGNLRWAPPAEPLCRNVATDAGRFRSVCPQVRPPSSSGKVSGQEDCLFINVWTPTLQPDAKLAVMVWIHGGFLHSLSGGEPGYSPTEKLAADTGVVYVSFNYRLNAFGFLTLEMLREGSPKNTSGNYGFMDQIAALKWVQKNVHVFGGDPGKVTIFGGGSSVWTLMMSPLAKGLFWAAVDMSGSYVYNTTLEQAESDGRNLEFLKKTSCKDLTCLRRLSVRQIMQAVPWQQYPSWAAAEVKDLPVKGQFLGPVAAVVDGYVLEAPPLEVWEKKGGHSDVPFVIGTMEQEVDFSPPAENISTWIWGDYRWFVNEKLKSFGGNLSSAALDLYPSSAHCPTTDRCPERAYTTMVSDIRVTCPNNDLALRAAAALSSPVYRYVVTYTPSRPVNTSSSLLPFSSCFSFHRLDAMSFFGALDSVLGKPPSDTDRKFQDLIRRHLVNFAKTGKMAQEWPKYPAATALLSNNLSVAESYSAEKCRLWKENGLFAYAWTN